MLPIPLKTFSKKFLSAWFSAPKLLEDFLYFVSVGLRIIFFSQNLMIYAFILIEVISLVISAMGFQIFNPGTILTRIKNFSFGSVTFSFYFLTGFVAVSLCLFSSNCLTYIYSIYFCVYTMFVEFLCRYYWQKSFLLGFCVNDFVLSSFLKCMLVENTKGVKIHRGSWVFPKIAYHGAS